MLKMSVKKSAKNICPLLIMAKLEMVFLDSGTYLINYPELKYIMSGDLRLFCYT